MGMAELLSMTKLTEEQQEYVEIMRSSGETLLNIINDVLDLSKIEVWYMELLHEFARFFLIMLFVSYLLH